MLTKKIGRRGTILAIFSIVFVVYGYRLISIREVFIPLLFAHPDLWGYVWIVVGMLCLVSTVFRIGWDLTGFFAGVSALVFWSASYFLTAIFEGQPIRSVAAGVISMMFSVVLGVVSGWPEIPKECKRGGK